MKQDNAFSLPAKLLRYLLMAFVLMISLYPILWVFLNSFKRTPGGLGLPDEWVLDGYITIFTKLNIGQYFLNSLIVTVISLWFLLRLMCPQGYPSKGKTSLR
jgi:raffinose/stachyose/melibiose transport system permease protein